MLLSDIFGQLTYGELAQLSIGDSEPVAIANYPKLVSHVNLALTDLHTRLPLYFREAIIQEYEEIEIYYLRSIYAATNTASTEPIKYITDTVYNPFTDDVLKIEQVFSEDGVEYPINDEMELYSVFTPSFDAVQIPFNDSNNAFSVMYRANHPKITIGTSFDPSTETVNLPLACVSALQYFVASRMFASMGEAGIQESNNYILKYENAISLLEKHNIFRKDTHGNDKLRVAGWV